ncbi:MAG: hypothetical protein ACOYVK_10120 [Bacillota bacterium]
MDNNLLVQEILKGITHRVAKEGTIGQQDAEKKHDHRKANILIVLSDPRAFTEERIKQLKTLKRYGYELYLVLTRDFEREINKEQLKRILYAKVTYAEDEKKQWQSLCEKTDLLFCPLLSQNTGAKLRAGIHDEAESGLIWEFLWLGKTVVVDPDNLRRRHGKAANNGVLAGMVEETIEHLKKMDVCFLDDINYYTALSKILQDSKKGESQTISVDPSDNQNERNSGKKVITEKDILQLVGKTNQLYLQKNCIITPLARDKAREKGIALIRR